MTTKPMLAAIAASVLMAGCAGPMPMAHAPQFAPVQPLPREKPAYSTGAIFASDSTDMWQAKRRDYRVGDIITVLLSESTQAARTLNNETSRESSNNAVPSGLTTQLQNLFPSTAGLSTSGAKISNKGKGVADQQASLTGSIAVTVAEAGGNVEEVHHQRAFSLQPVQNVDIELVLQTRGRAHLAEVLASGEHASPMPEGATLQ